MTEVWTPLSAVFAVLSGIMFGLAVGWIAVNPVYSASIAGALRIGTTAAVFAASGGLTFFAFQALAARLGGDPLWTRVMARYGLWVVFSVAVGATTFVRVRRDRNQRRKRAHQRVASELGADGS